MIDKKGVSVSALLESSLGLIPIETAAAELGIEVKRLRGYMFRNKVGDPIGDGNQVYRWSLETIRKRIASQPEARS